MNWTAIGLLIGLFLSNALALDCLYRQNYKGTGILNIIGLCLVVACAYTFDQIKNIALLLVLGFSLVVVLFVVRLVLKKKKNG